MIDFFYHICVVSKSADILVEWRMLSLKMYVSLNERP